MVRLRVNDGWSGGPQPCGALGGLLALAENGPTCWCPYGLWLTCWEVTTLGVLKSSRKLNLSIKLTRGFLSLGNLLEVVESYDFFATFGG